MKDMPADEDNVPIFILSDSANVYKTRLEQLGPTMNNRIHTTRLKDMLLSELSNLRTQSQVQETLLLLRKIQVQRSRMHVNVTVMLFASQKQHRQSPYTCLRPDLSWTMHSKLITRNIMFHLPSLLL